MFQRSVQQFGLFALAPFQRTRHHVPFVKAIARSPRPMRVRTIVLPPAVTNHPATDTQVVIHLYQYAICPFCHSVKTLLQYARVDYQVIEVNPLTKAEIKAWKGTYSKVPIVTLTHRNADTVTSTTPLFGSDTILQALLDQPDVQDKLQHKWQTAASRNGAPNNAMTLDAFRSAPSVQQWHDFRNDLAAVLYPNMCRTYGESVRAFDYVHDGTNAFGPLERVCIQYVGALAMYVAASRIKKKRHMTNEREALEALLVSLDDALSESHGYLSRHTTQPHLGDLVVFGTLRSIQRLPVVHHLIRNRPGPIRDWYDRLVAHVES